MMDDPLMDPNPEVYDVICLEFTCDKDFCDNDEPWQAQVPVEYGLILVDDYAVCPKCNYDTETFFEIEDDI